MLTGRENIFFGAGGIILHFEGGKLAENQLYHRLQFDWICAMLCYVALLVSAVLTFKEQIE